jgi:hypothetical protein
MSESRNPSTIMLLVLGVAWVAFAAFDFYDASERGGYTLNNTRFIRALVAAALAIAAFVAFGNARRPRA